MKQSGFMEKQLAMRRALIDATERVTQQLMMDTLQIVLHNELGFGHDRIMRITKAWSDSYNHYRNAFNTKYVEADVLRVHLDRELTDILKGHQDLIPFEERYPEIKEITYKNNHILE